MAVCNVREMIIYDPSNVEEENRRDKKEIIAILPGCGVSRQRICAVAYFYPPDTAPHM